MIKNLTVRFFSCSIFYLLLSVTLGVALAAGFLSRNAIPAHAHLALIGWVSITIIGAMYQLVPTIRGTELFSEKLANLQFWMINIGTMGLFLGLLLENFWMKVFFGFLLLVSSYIFAYIIFKTLFSIKERIELTLRFFGIAILYFLIAITLGLLMIANVIPNFLGAHAHLALIGWVSLTIMGAEYQMVPMLALKELYSEKLSNIQFWMVNSGAIGIFFAFVISSKILIGLFGGVFFISSLIFAWIIYKTLTQDKKMQEKVDISVKFFLTAIIYLLIASILGLFLPFGILYLKIAHVHLALVGWVSLTIIGGMYHIMPMLVWMEKYGEKLGKEPIPMIKDMYSERLANSILWMVNAGTIGMFFGAIFGKLFLLSGIIIALASYLFAFDMFNVLRR
ncbi:MAG: cbb3-type cytochrome c oxidase subunit I [Candidatus Hydrothermarchaeota archaeon]